MADKGRYLLGLDIGSSFIKASLLDADSNKVVISASSPEKELKISALKTGWAEQDPEIWWQNVICLIGKIKNKYPEKINNAAAIGISYQMHGLVLVDKNKSLLRPAIIWCDSRAVSIGQKTVLKIGKSDILDHSLNFPGNFTASKLKWVMENEPDLFSKAYKFMLPGDYIAMKLTGEICTTKSGLSECILWDYKENKISSLLLDYYGIDKSLIPQIVPTFGVQGVLSDKECIELGLKSGIKISYRAGDQPNNAFSLNVMNPGEVAATAGTSGVVYAVNNKISYDEKSRVNTFIHVNHDNKKVRLGTLMCLNGAGILNSWIKNNLTMLNNDFSYDEMNFLAQSIMPGANDLFILPYGNGAERTLEDKNIGCSIHNLNFNIHSLAHLYRAAQEGVVFALNYGIDIMKEMGIKIKTLKAGNANLFLSPIFRQSFANTADVSVEILNSDGTHGAARGGGVGAGIYSDFDEALSGIEKIHEIVPDEKLKLLYQEKYVKWKKILENCLKNIQ